MVIPGVYLEYSTSRVLDLQHIEGTRFRDIRPLLLTPSERRRVASMGADAIFRMAFEDGFFHGDPHPGNLILTPEGHLALLDFGMVGYMSRGDIEALSGLFIAVVQRDGAGALRGLESLGVRFVAGGARRSGARSARVSEQVLGPLGRRGNARAGAFGAHLAGETLPVAGAARIPASHEGARYGRRPGSGHRPYDQRLRDRPPVRAQAAGRAFRARRLCSRASARRPSSTPLRRGLSGAGPAPPDRGVRRGARGATQAQRPGRAHRQGGRARQPAGVRARDGGLAPRDRACSGPSRSPGRACPTSTSRSSASWASLRSGPDLRHHGLLRHRFSGREGSRGSPRWSPGLPREPGCSLV